MNSNNNNVVLQMLMYGAILAVAKIVYLFFDASNVFDFVLFVAAGIILGGKIPSKQSQTGFLLCIPTFILCLIFVLNLGYKSIVNGIGTTYAISLVVIPVSTIIGLFINTKLPLQKNKKD